MRRYCLADPTTGLIHAIAPEVSHFNEGWRADRDLFVLHNAHKVGDFAQFNIATGEEETGVQCNRKSGHLSADTCPLADTCPPSTL